MERQQDYVLRSVEERGVRLIRLWFTDVLGQLKSFAITPAELENALEEGMTFDGSSIDGFSRVQESDVLARPDANSFELLPWADPAAPEARMFCDIVNLDGTPFEGDPRQVLRRNLDRARERGLLVLRRSRDGVLLLRARRRRPARSRSTPAPTSTSPRPTSPAPCRKRTIQTLEAMGIPVEYSFHEDSPSQHEIDLRHTDALSMADSVMTFRLVVREAAAAEGLYATFMPKPLEGVQGSGMHTHLSLFEGDVNAFHDPGDPYNLSKIAKGFIAGLLVHAPEITAITNQTVNSYKRLIHGFEAPVFISWARNNRSALIRVPVAKSKAQSTRIEYRSPDPATNPYLAFSVMLAAGLKGIEEGYELPTEAATNIFELTDEERAAEGLEALPQSLSDALRVMERSELVAEALGEHIFEWFLRNKRREWRAYKTQVTPFEIDRYLRTL